MSVNVKYRLQPLLRLKERLKKQAEIVLAKAIGQLEKEKRRKQELEDEKKQLIQKKKDIRQELDEKLYSQEGVVSDSFQYIDFIKGIDSDIKQKKRDIEQQEGLIEDAERVVGRARRDYIDAAREHKVMEKHKELWTKKIQKEINMKDQKELDELAQVIHQMAR